MRRGVISTLFPLLLHSAACLAGEPQWYTIELLAFAHASSAGLEEERWSEPPSALDLKNSVKLTTASPLLDEELLDEPPSGATPFAFQLLASEEHLLGDAQKKLRRGSRYEPLLHIAWRQPGFSKKEARTVYIYSGMEKETELAPEEPFVEPGPEVIDASQLLEKREPTVIPALEGTVRLYRERYLHLNADLRHFRPTSGVMPGLDAAGEEPLEVPRPTRFRLLESRRMRSKELHYLDHPLFGLLVQVTPYEPEEIPVEEPVEVESAEPPPSPEPREEPPIALPSDN